MKKIINKYMTFFLCAVVLSSCLILSNNNSIVRAASELHSVTITGNIYCSSGDSDFWQLVGDNKRSLIVHFFDKSNNEIGSTYVSDRGQYSILINDFDLSDTLVYAAITDNFNLLYRYNYLFNTYTSTKFFGSLIDQYDGVNYRDLYFDFRIVNGGLGDNFHNYLFNSVSFTTSSSNPITNRVYLPSDNLIYYNNFTLDTSFKFNSDSYGSYPAFWFNFNDTENKFCYGVGFIFSYAGSTDSYPWRVYLKDNVSGRKILVFQLNSSDLSNLPVLHLRLRSFVNNDGVPYLSVFYGYDESVTHNNLKFGFTLPSKGYNISSLVLQNYGLNGSFDYSFNYDRYVISKSDWQSIYQNGFNDGKSQGEKIGYQNGYNAGLTDDKITFTSMLSAVFDAPIRVIVSLFDIEILGYNLRTFVFSVATLIIVVSIVKIVLGFLSN